MNVTELFEQRISEWLEQEKQRDEQFAARLEVVMKEDNPKGQKTVKGACNYVLSVAKASRQVGYDDAEVYGMVRHYFDEDDVKDPGDQHPSKVVVTGHVELSEAEKAEAMAKAQEAYMKELREADRRRQEAKDRREKERMEALKERRRQEQQMQGDLFGGF